MKGENILVPCGSRGVQSINITKGILVFHFTIESSWSEVYFADFLSFLIFLLFLFSRQLLGELIIAFFVGEHLEIAKSADFCSFYFIHLSFPGLLTFDRCPHSLGGLVKHLPFDPLLTIVQYAVPREIVRQVAEIREVVGLECSLQHVLLLVVVLVEGRLKLRQFDVFVLRGDKLEPSCFISLLQVSDPSAADVQVAVIGYVAAVLAVICLTHVIYIIKLSTSLHPLHTLLYYEWTD